MLIDPDKEAERFISLREVLFLIAEARQCDPQKAAQWLARNLGGIDFKTYDPVEGLLNVELDYPLSWGGTGINALDLLAREGVFRLIETPISQWDDNDIPF